MVLVAIACGLAGASGAILFRLMIRFCQAAFFGGPDGIVDVVHEGLLADAGDPLELASSLAWYWRLLIPAAGGAIVGPLIYFFARDVAIGFGRNTSMAIGPIRPCGLLECARISNEATPMRSHRGGSAFAGPTTRVRDRGCLGEGVSSPLN